jgi:hypothetical protein
MVIDGVQEIAFNSEVTFFQNCSKLRSFFFSFGDSFYFKDKKFACLAVNRLWWKAYHHSINSRSNLSPVWQNKHAHCWNSSNCHFLEITALLSKSASMGFLGTVRRIHCPRTSLHSRILCPLHDGFTKNDKSYIDPGFCKGYLSGFGYDFLAQSMLRYFVSRSPWEIKDACSAWRSWQFCTVHPGVDDVLAGCIPVPLFLVSEAVWCKFLPDHPSTKCLQWILRVICWLISSLFYISFMVLSQFLATSSLTLAPIFWFWAVDDYPQLGQVSNVLTPLQNLV